MRSEDLRICLLDKQGTRVVKLIGELDAFTIDRLAGISKSWLYETSNVVVNLDELEYIDSTGLAALVGLWVQARDAGTKMVISCQSPRVHKVLEITGLLNFFATETEDEIKGTHTAYNQNTLSAEDMKSDPKRIMGKTPKSGTTRPIGGRLAD